MLSGMGQQTRETGRPGTVNVESQLGDDARRRRLYEGELFAFAPRRTTLEFRDHAWQMISEAFAPHDPFSAQDEMPVEAFVERLAPLKSKFPHDPRSKELLGALLTDLGCDPADTYFDFPKLRVVTHSDYLTSGVGYTYRAHRDSWYGPPPSQINWWMAVSDVAADSAMALHPRFWGQPVENDSKDFDVYDWNAKGRKEAAQHIRKDTRNHPYAPGVSVEPHDLRLVGPGGFLMAFSAAHLHSSIPNTSGRTRFSVDFRTTNRADLEAGRGAFAVDDESTGTTLRDFHRVDDLSPVPDDLIRKYETGDVSSGALVFEPEG